MQHLNCLFFFVCSICDWRCCTSVHGYTSAKPSSLLSVYSAWRRANSEAWGANRTSCSLCLNKIQNPNEAFYDWRLETRTSADVYISPDDLEESSSLTKRQVLQSLHTTIFISIEGQSGINNFTLNTTYGDTSSSAQPTTTTPLQVSSNV